jgi:hypothetical protein
MRYLSLMIAIASLPSCNRAGPLNCKAIEQRVYACLDRFAQGAEQLKFFGECMPMSQPQRFRGTWATDFEFNQFQSGEATPSADPLKLSEPYYQLWGHSLEKYQVGSWATVAEMEFIGRRPVCDLTDPARDILVDRVIRVRVIDQRPSEW